MSGAQTDPTSAVIEAIRKCDAEELGKYFNDMVDLNLPGFRDTYSKTQSTRILKDFFSGKTPVTLTQLKQGDSPDGSRYVMGFLGGAGKKYSFYVTFRKSGGEFRIFGLEIQED